MFQHFEEDLSANFICSEEGIILNCNTSFIEILGYPSKKDATESNFNRHFSNSHHQKIFWQTLQKLGKIKNHEMSARKVNGETVYLILNITLNNQNDNDSDYAFGQFQDITDRKMANMSLKKSEERYRTLIETMDNWIWELDRKFQFTYSNSKTYSLFNKNPNALKGDSLFHFMPENESEKLKKTLNNLAAEKKPFINLEHPIVHFEGELLIFETSGTPIYDENGNFKGYRCISRDITDRKRAQDQIIQLNNELEDIIAARTHELELANRELEAFSYSVSHDLKAPLRRIKGFSDALDDLLDRESVDQNALLYLEKIQLSAKHMSELIQSLIQLAKVTRSKLNMTQINLSSLVYDVSEMYSLDYTQKRYTLKIEENVTTIGDKSLLKTALQNLIGNAFKFTSKKEYPVIEFGTLHENQETVYYIRDNGDGFKMEYSEKLFVPFQRLHSDREFSGNGIGLPTVKRIINRHFGKVWAESTPDKGATFYFTLNADNNF